MRKLYTMSCKNKECKVPGGYKYKYEGEWYEFERCPICGHGAPFEEFMDYEEPTNNNSR